jgi:hypothetical protein
LAATLLAAMASPEALAPMLLPNQKPQAAVRSVVVVAVAAVSTPNMMVERTMWLKMRVKSPATVPLQIVSSQNVTIAGTLVGLAAKADDETSGTPSGGAGSLLTGPPL